MNIYSSFQYTIGTRDWQYSHEIWDEIIKFQLKEKAWDITRENRNIEIQQHHDDGNKNLSRLQVN